MLATIKFSNTTYFADSSVYSKDQMQLERYFDRKALLKQPDSVTKAGRGKTLLYTLNGTKLVLRHYRRGGVAGHIAHDRFFKFEPYAHRAYDEMKLLYLMRALNLPVPEPVIARQENHVLFLKQDLVIKQIENALDLSCVIAKRHLTADEFKNIGMTLKLFFNNGIYHSDLNIRNVLLKNDGSIWLIDFDKCKKTSLDDRLKRLMIDRLLRSFLKEQKERNPQAHFNRADFSFLKQEAL